MEENEYVEQIENDIKAQRDKVNELKKEIKKLSLDIRKKAKALNSLKGHNPKRKRNKEISEVE